LGTAAELGQLMMELTQVPEAHLTGEPGGQVVLGGGIDEAGGQRAVSATQEPSTHTKGWAAGHETTAVHAALLGAHWPLAQRIGWLIGQLLEAWQVCTFCTQLPSAQVVQPEVPQVAVRLEQAAAVSWQEPSV